MTVTLTLTGGPVDWLDHSLRDLTGSVPPLIVWPGPTKFGGIGSGTIIETLAPHDPGPGDVEFLAPRVISFRLGEPPSGLVITGATGTLTGNHYYLTPEPGAVALVGAGLVFLVWKKGIHNLCCVGSVGRNF